MVTMCRVEAVVCASGDAQPAETPPPREKEKRSMPGIFFFSIRRRHTRSLRDWSSDVCSSDLLQALGEAEVGDVGLALGVHQDVGRLQRSEERRVGKECRSWGSPYHSQIK